MKCKYCGKEFEYKSVKGHKKRFCNILCYGRYYRTTDKYKEKAKRYQKRANEISKLRYKKNPLEYRKTRKKYAKSEKAREIYRSQYYKNKEIILIRKSDRDKAIKDKCHICGSKINLEIHHISYKPSVYIILCRNCHLKEHNKRCLK